MARLTLLLALATAAHAFVPAPIAVSAKARTAPRAQRTSPMMAGADTMVPDMNKRNLMNLILVFGGALPAISALGVPYVLFFIPKTKAGGGGGVTALDRNGDAVTVEGWLKDHGANSKALVQGLKGDATYLLVKEDGKTIEDFGINAVCTHLGCVVPWNQAENKFMCPCHGSQYNNQGKVVRGPAPLSLAIGHVKADTGPITISTWTETDFRTGLAPWWK